MKPVLSKDLTKVKKWLLEKGACIIQVNLNLQSQLWLSQTPSNQGPVVQSVVSLTSSLRVISLTVLADSIYNILIFFAEKM